MGRPRKQPQEKRTEQTNIRLTLAEAVYVREQADAAGVPVPEYLRRRALGYRVPAPIRRSGSDPQLVVAVNRVGVNVNQLARAVHRGSDFARYWREVGDQVTRVLEDITAEREQQR